MRVYARIAPFVHASLLRFYSVLRLMILGISGLYLVTFIPWSILFDAHIIDYYPFIFGKSDW